MGESYSEGIVTRKNANTMLVQKSNKIQKSALSKSYDRAKIRGSNRTGVRAKRLHKSSNTGESAAEPHESDNTSASTKSSLKQGGTGNPT
jgi:hypothetical protein